MISACYQFLHVTQPEMSIFLVLLSDVVDELIQDFVLFLLFFFFSVLAFIAVYCIVFSAVGE